MNEQQTSALKKIGALLQHHPGLSLNGLGIVIFATAWLVADKPGALVPLVFCAINAALFAIEHEGRAVAAAAAAAAAPPAP